LEVLHEKNYPIIKLKVYKQAGEIIYAVAGVFFHPPLSYSEFLKRNEEALFIRVVGGGQKPTTACTLFLSNTCNGGVAYP
jgi:hypothetical protein